jgi:hypothetical protein
VPAAIAALALLTTCGDDSDGTSVDPETASLVYEFHDSSVPPEFHRSYTLTADATSANLVVDSYGDVLHDVTEPMDSAVWEETVQAAAQLEDGSDTTSEGCAGGTSEELHLRDADREVIDVFVDHCGADAGDDLGAVVGEVLAMFDLEDLLATS